MAGYKTNSKKSVAFIYSKDKQAEKEITEMTHLMKVIRNIKYLGSDSNQASERSVWQELQVSEERKKPKKISEDGKISHTLGLAGLI